DDIARAFEATRHGVCPRVVDADVAGAAEIFEVLVTRAQALVAERLAERIPGAIENGKPVGRGALVDVIGGVPTAGARHVLDHDRGLPRDVLAQICGEGARERVNRAASVDPDDHGEPLAGVEVARLGASLMRETRDPVCEHQASGKCCSLSHRLLAMPISACQLAPETPEGAFTVAPDSAADLPGGRNSITTSLWIRRIASQQPVAVTTVPPSISVSTIRSQSGRARSQAKKLM